MIKLISVSIDLPRILEWQGLFIDPLVGANLYFNRELVRGRTGLREWVIPPRAGRFHEGHGGESYPVCGSNGLPRIRRWDGKVYTHVAAPRGWDVGRKVLKGGRNAPEVLYVERIMVVT